MMLNIHGTPALNRRAQRRRRAKTFSQDAVAAIAVCAFMMLLTLFAGALH